MRADANLAQPGNPADWAHAVARTLVPEALANLAAFTNRGAAVPKNPGRGVAAAAAPPPPAGILHPDAAEAVRAFFAQIDRQCVWVPDYRYEDADDDQGKAKIVPGRFYAATECAWTDHSRVLDTLPSRLATSSGLLEPPDLPAAGPRGLQAGHLVSHLRRGRLAQGPPPQGLAKTALKLNWLDPRALGQPPSPQTTGRAPEFA